MNLVPWPKHVDDLLEALAAPPRLVTHLMLVQQVAIALTQALEQTWPGLPYDRQAVLLGAATHDIGKTIHRQELRQPGHRHEEAGVSLLLQYGFSPEQARFARTHAQWRQDPTPTFEDLLVALADTTWKGKRGAELEDALVQQIARLRAEEPWAIYLALDKIVQAITRDADTRLAWHTRHPA